MLVDRWDLPLILPAISELENPNIRKRTLLASKGVLGSRWLLGVKSHFSLEMWSLVGCQSLLDGPTSMPIWDFVTRLRGHEVRGELHCGDHGGTWQGEWKLCVQDTLYLCMYIYICMYFIYIWNFQRINRYLIAVMEGLGTKALRTA